MIGKGTNMFYLRRRKKKTNMLHWLLEKKRAALIL